MGIFGHPWRSFWRWIGPLWPPRPTQSAPREAIEKKFRTKMVRGSSVGLRVTPQRHPKSREMVENGRCVGERVIERPLGGQRGRKLGTVCAENIINTVVFVRFVVVGRIDYLSYFWVYWGCIWGYLGPIGVIFDGRQMDYIFY